MDKRKEIINNKLNELSKSKFRSSFHLRKYMVKYIDEIGLNKIKTHAYDFVNKNLKVRPINDGKQTPTKNHPVFIAQHACGCCCRGCLEKWHNIPKEKELSDNEINYIVSLIMEWIIKEYKSNKNML
ncbi:MAG: DUF4186 domain-containing protein [Bacilli bacterium]|nr:DUF4186 domain-containing protein [Bacilli bacterium]